MDNSIQVTVFCPPKPQVDAYLFTGMRERFIVRHKVLLPFNRVNNKVQESQAWNILVNGPIEVTTIEELSSG